MRLAGRVGLGVGRASDARPAIASLQNVVTGSAQSAAARQLSAGIAEVLRRGPSQAVGVGHSDHEASAAGKIDDFHGATFRLLCESRLTGDQRGLPHRSERCGDQASNLNSISSVRGGSRIQSRNRYGPSLATPKTCP